jgi:CubicO group peptidase (beta-lactamase class C family)
MMAVVGGRVLYEYGDVTTVTYLASVRKSVLAMLFGNYVANGKIRLAKTLAELKIDDHQGLTASEKEATIADLLGARSSDSTYGSGFSSTAYTTENTAVFAPMPSASATIALIANTGDRRSVRSAYRTSWSIVSPSA